MVLVIYVLLMRVIIYLGVVWVIRLTASGSWYRNIVAFPNAIDKKGEPKLDHESVLKYVRDNS